ncbi:MAG: 23S rRNA (pseudouridine(1915)-N(3))-methyltransferase RlmH [Terriglobia bacterium]
MRIRLIWEGKTRDERLRALQEDYARRIGYFTELKIEEIPARARHNKGPSAAERLLLEKVGRGRKVVLDERGQEWTSQDLASWMSECALRGTREVTFLVGGPEGFSEAFREHADVLFALSRMTLTRDWARTLLLEQIYRGFTIQQGHPYPR